MDSDKGDTLIYGMSAAVLAVALCALCYSFGHERGFKAGVVAAWECHTDMECETLEERVKQ